MFDFTPFLSYIYAEWVKKEQGEEISNDENLTEQNLAMEDQRDGPKSSHLLPYLVTGSVKRTLLKQRQVRETLVFCKLFYKVFHVFF